MKRTSIAISPIVLLLTVIGCSDSPEMRDQRLAEFAKQAVKAVRTDLISRLPKMHRNGKLITNDLHVEVLPLSVLKPAAA